jgi:NAD+ diphosphatase
VRTIASRRRSSRPGAHILAFTGSRLILKHDSQILDPLFSPYELAELKPDFDNAVLLGYHETGEPRIAVPMLIPAEELASHFKPTEARALFRDQLIEGEPAGRGCASRCTARNWNAANKFCGKCGSPTETRIGGYKRVCTQCQHMTFPRTDPVVIMLTVDIERDRCLLGRSHAFSRRACIPASPVSSSRARRSKMRCAAKRLEESGIRTGRVRYHASQPWPLPHSLMIGCYAEAKSTAIKRDEQELEDVRWFDAGGNRGHARACHGRRPTPVFEHIPPPKGAIAHQPACATGSPGPSARAEVPCRAIGTPARSHPDAPALPPAGQRPASSPRKPASVCRTLYRDIASLQARGALHRRRARSSATCCRPGFMLPPMMFSEEEIEALVLGSRWVAKTRRPAARGRSRRCAGEDRLAVLPADLKEELEHSTLLVGPAAR